MKFSLNGALTIGTLDGANVEIREEVGAENFFLFGLTAEEVAEVKSRGYRPRDYYEQNAELRDVIDFIASGALGGGDTELFHPLVDNLLGHDPFLLLADYQAYVDARTRSARSGATRRPGRASRSSTPRAWANSLPTARSATTANASGRCSQERSSHEPTFERNPQ